MINYWFLVVLIFSLAALGLMLVGIVDLIHKIFDFNEE